MFLYHFFTNNFHFAVQALLRYQQAEKLLPVDQVFLTR